MIDAPSNSAATPSSAPPLQPNSPECKTDNTRIVEQRRQCYRANRERILAQQKEYYRLNRERILERNRHYMASLPPEERRVRHRAYNAKWWRTKGRNRQRWAERNPEKRREVARRYAAKVLTTPKGRIDHRMSTSIGAALGGNKAGRKWESLVGYTLSDLKYHLERRFQPGMNWEKLMNGEIHIDHVIPKSKFTYASPSDIEFRRCWALENLQPMWASENYAKRNTLSSAAQIALGI